MIHQPFPSNSKAFLFTPTNANAVCADVFVLVDTVRPQVPDKRALSATSLRAISSIPDALRCSSRRGYVHI